MKALSALVLLLFSFTASPMGDQPRRTYYVALGDSISAGFLAYTNSSQEWRGETISTVSPLALENQEPPPPYLWMGWRYASMMESKKHWSWATGNRPHSVAERLQDWLNTTSPAPQQLKAINMAQSGIRAEHLPRQARQAVEKLKESGADSLELVTFVFGGNDACKVNSSRQEDADALKANFKKSMEYLATTRQFMSDQRAIRVFVSGLPNIPMLDRPEIQQHKSLWGMNCKTVRDKIVNTCRKLMGWTTPEELNERVSRVAFVNNAIREAAESFKNDPRFSIVFDNSFFETDITGPMLSVDCFHPGKNGQKQMAEQFWQKMPWFH